VLAYAAHAKGCSVLAVDIDKETLDRLKNAGFTAKYSDKFSKVSGKFDTIICNPPYLPQDKKVSDSTLYGGKKGYEYIIDIITQAKHYLESDGQLLFLISTLTKPTVVEKALLNEGYSWKIISRKKLFMEELLVYRAGLAIGEPATLLGRGKRSLVYSAGKRAVKVSTPERAAKEASLLKAVNKLGIGPRYYKREHDKLFIQRISGEPFNEYITRTKDIRAMKQLLQQARILDKAGIKKQELGRPGTNVLVTKTKRVVLLDFERSIYTNKPNNLTQAATYISKLLGINALDELSAYKRSYSEHDYKALLSKLFS